MKRQILVCLFVLFVLVASAGAGDFDFLLGYGKLIDAQTIVDQFEAGETWVKVIVNLAEPVQMKALTDWDSAASAGALRAEIARRQEPVLSSLTSAEFTLGHRFENQAGFSGEVTVEGLTKLLNDPLVVSVEPDRILEPHLAQGIPLMNATTARMAYNGKGMAIAIVDTGIDYTHPMLGGTVFPNGFPNAKVIGGYDFGSNDPDPMPGFTPGHAHGTACAGIAAGDLSVNGDYIGGVAHNAKIYAVKIAPDYTTGAMLSAMIAAWDWCVTHKNDDPDNPIMVTSTSYGGMQHFSAPEGDSFSPGVTTAANTSVAAGITVLSSSGNNGWTNSLGWPASISSVISVGAVFDDTFVHWLCGQAYPDLVTCYSNSAYFLDILAPAENAYTADIVGFGGYAIGDYTPDFGGTSAACPYAAGAVACLQSAALARTGSYLSPLIVRHYLTTNGDPIFDMRPVVPVTKPRVNLGRTIDCIEDTFAPTPDPPEWEPGLEPNETGRFTIAMEAGECADDADVEYYFECVEDGNFDSGWQSSPGYIATGLAEDTTYTFRVKARDTSTNQNETNWSIGKSATTDLNTDTSPPFPPTSRWAMEPRKFTETIIGMAVRISSDENDPVEYFFDCTAYSDPCVLDPNIFDSGWQTGSTYLIPGLSYASYTFRVKARDSSTNQNETAPSSAVSVTLGPPPRVLEVPSTLYNTIQAAINDSNDGDTVLVHPGTYGGFGNRDLDFLGKAITVRSENPDDRNVVATTIIDCGGGPSPFMSHRAFIFQNGEGTDSIVAGFTIINGHIRPGGWNGSYPGGDGQDAFGGAISCIGSSPTIRKCVITDCVADGSGGYGGPGNPDPDPDIPGGDGGNNASAYGGAIYCDPNSSPIIEYCTISDCSVISNGGDGGDGEPGFDPNEPEGTGGNGGNAFNDVFGGAIYIDANSGAIISNCVITDNESVTPMGGAGGGGEVNGSPGSGGGLAFCGGVYFGTGYTGTMSNTEVSGNVTGGGGGGGIYCEGGADTTPMLDNCSIVGNLAAAGHGGGIWYGYGGMLTLNNCEVSGNSATGNRGGGIYGGVGGAPLVGTSITLNNSIVSNNASQYGGGIYVEDTILTINDSTISSNTAASDGGGMCLVETDSIIDNFTISDNSAVHGGGAYYVNSVADFKNGTISGNFAAGSGYSSGAGLYCDDSSTTIKNCVMTGNRSDGSGGAVYFMGPYIPGGTQELINCLIADNNAFWDGAGVSANVWAMPKIANCTIAGNEVLNSYGYSSGGGVSCYDAFVEIIDGILWGNTAVYGPQIAIGDPLETNNPMATVMLWYSDIEGGPGAVFEGQPQGTGPFLYLPLPGTVIDDNPNFAMTSLTEQGYNYYLSQIAAGQLVDSPCVDIGSSPASALAAAVGFDVTTRTDHVADAGTVDMGYHYDARLDPIRYQLTIIVVNSEGGRLKASAGGSAPFEIWDPNTRREVNPGTIVDLEAIPNPGYEVKMWFGTDDDTSWDPNNTATMYSNRYVAVEFRQPQSFYVPVQYPTIQAAMDAAFHHGDNVVVRFGTYGGGYDFRGKSITVASERPDDPCYVAATIIDCVGFGPAFIFRGGEKAPDAAIDGFTIVNGGGYPVYVRPPEPNQAYDGFGGAIAGLGESSPLISNCVIRNCMAWGRDGYDGLDRTPDGIPDGPGGDGGHGGSGFGGAIAFDANSSPTIRNCKIIGSRALGGNGGSGGHAKGAAPSGVGYPGGDAGDGGEAYGGAMYFETGCKPIIENCIIRDSNTTQGMGNVGGNGGNGDPGGPGGAGSVNGDESLGGAILYRENCEPTVLNTVIINSTANAEVAQYIWPGGTGGDTNGPDGMSGFSYTLSCGGAHYYDVNCTAEITNCAISNSAVISDGITSWGTQQTDDSGGAEYYRRDCNSKIIDCNFTNSTAGDSAQASGGVLFFEPDCVVDINDSTFVSGLAPGLYSYGGVIYWQQAERVTINNSYFVSSEATYGGALAWHDPDPNVLISNCIILDNIADHGGGLLWYEGTPTIRGCKIRGNTAEGRMVPVYYGTVPPGYGFGMEFYGGGGGIFCWMSNAIIEDCVIEDNTTSGSGGGVYFGGDTSFPILKNCLVRGNSAVLDGGGIVSYWLITPTISNCTIVNNTAYDPENSTYRGRGGGLCCSYESKTILSDSILWGNSASRGNQILIGSESDPNITQRPAELTVSYCDIQGGQSPQAIHIEPGRILNWLSGNINADPLFVPGPLGDYYLSQMAAGQGSDSPCVDAGSADANNPNIGLDSYTTRTDSIGDAGTVDMGYHYADPSGLRTVQLTVTVVGGHGTAEPTSPAPISYDPVSGIYTYYRGTAVILTATPDASYRVASWSGTINDGSTALTNVVVMSSDKAVSVQFEKPRAISVPADYPTIIRAIDAAEEGDQVILSPGFYTPPGGLSAIVLWRKNITLTSINPDDPNVVANTILQGYYIILYEVGPETVVTGFTMRNTSWFAPSGIDGQDPGDSGFNGSPIRGGAIDITDASPTLVNIVIDNISISAGDGGDGADGDGTNVNGGNGGWGGSAYGGAIYIENSSPTFKGVTIVNCGAYSGNGGDGGNGNGDPPGYGGRGGSWTFWEFNEDYWEALGLGWDYPMDRYGYYLFDPFTGMYVGSYEDFWLYTTMGAAVYVDSTSKPTFIDCIFEDNQTESGYCGVEGSGPLGSPGPSYHERIESFGTGIYCEVGSAPTFIDCNFTDNIADSDVPTAAHSPYLTYGGGLACGTLTHKENPGSTNSLKLINCTFTDNAATIGGAIFWADTAPTIEDCNFSDNYAYQGGAMFCSENSTPLIVGSIFTQNDTGYVSVGDPNSYYTVGFASGDITVGPPIEDVLGLGGAMVCSSSGAHIVDCLFNTNTTSCSGGAIYTIGSERLLVKNCLITENSADRDGGGISVNWNSEPNIINCTIAENVVTGEGFAAGGYGGGVSCSYESYTVITNSIIWGNYALNGWDLAVTTGFEHDPRPAYVKVAYSDIKGGETAVFVDTGCVLDWDSTTNLSGTSGDVPMFVSDYVGKRFYLSQPYVVPPDPNQTELSPCVDAGSTYAYLLDLYRHTTRTDRVIDAGIADMGYHHLLTTDLVGDFDFNYMVNMSDLTLFLLHWLEEGCGPPDWCHGTDLNRDGVVDFVDYTTFVENYGLSDTTPPRPDPMTWAVAPNSIGPTSIYMAATRAYDNATGPYVEYYFNCVYGGGHDRDWGPSLTYTDTGLVKGNEYGYQVKARDTSSNQNETGWSIIGYAVPGEDVTPPLTDPNAPNPYQSTWAMPPTPSSGTSMYMVATTATDETGVEYYFEFTTGDGNDGHDSGWQSSPIYEDTGLDPNTTYTYRVRARDKWDPPNQNYGFWSVEASAATPEGEPPLPNPAQWLTLPEWRTDPNTAQLVHYMEAEPAADAVYNPCWYYFECAVGSGLDSGWQLSNIYTYPHTSGCVYVVRYSDWAGNPLLAPPLRAPGNVGQDSVPAYTGPRPP